MIFFTADTHFFHDNIIKYCRRPFKDVVEMNFALQENWNRKVQPEDTVYVIGDFIHPQVPLVQDAIDLIGALNGNIRIIPGDHELRSGVFSRTKAVLEDQITVVRTQDPQRAIVLCHWPFRNWRVSHYGAWHLFGHVHNNNKSDPYYRYGKSFNVGVDVWNFEPVSLDEVVKFADTCEQNFNYIPEENRAHR